MIASKSLLGPDPNAGSSALAVSVLAFLLVAGSFLLQGRIGLNLADEGYLWHGALRVLEGDLPIRDFQSYDPARYYWAALCMKLQGSEGVVALRRGVALFQALALAVALVLLRRVVTRPATLTLVALTLLLWFFPRHKLFDVGLSIGVIAAGTRLIELPTVSRYFQAGLFVGLAGFFGRNHGVYALAALSIVAVLAWRRLDRTRPLAKVSASIVGIGVGYLPILLLAAFEPGFLDALLRSVLDNIKNGPNLSISVPWPWRGTEGLPPQWAVHTLAVGWTFAALPVVYALGGVAVLREKRPEEIQRHSLFVASLAVGIAYAHYAYSRADIGHLAHAICPFLFVLFSAPAARRHFSGRWSSLAWSAAVLGYSLISAGMVSPFYSMISTRTYAAIEVRGDRLLVDPDTARTVGAVQSIARNHLRPRDRIVFAPYWPTMYAVLGRISPVWETYSNYPNDTEGQRRYIDELERGEVQWAVVGNALLDGLEDRRFERTHPSLWLHFAARYEPVVFEGLPEDYRLLRRRAPTEALLGASR